MIGTIEEIVKQVEALYPVFYTPSFPSIQIQLEHMKSKNQIKGTVFFYVNPPLIIKSCIVEIK